jgi:hypothetical protein
VILGEMSRTITLLLIDVGGCETDVERCEYGCEGDVARCGYGCEDGIGY